MLRAILSIMAVTGFQPKAWANYADQPLLVDSEANRWEQQLAALEVATQLSVLSVGLNAPPGSPTDGDTFVVGTSPTGGWAGKASQVARWKRPDLGQPGAWEFWAPRAGWDAYVVGGSVYRFNGTGWVRMLTNPVVYPEAHGATGNGIDDDKAAFDDAIAALPDGGVLGLRPGANYKLSGLVSCNKSVRIEGNGATISGSWHLLTIRKTISTYNAGNYFTTTKGAALFAIPGGVTINPGDVLLLQSNTARFPGTSYKWGQLVRVARTGGGDAVLENAFIGSFQVDTIVVYAGLDVMVDDVTFDNASAIQETSRSPAKTVEAIGNRIVFSRCRFLGADQAGYGLLAQGIHVRAIDCTARGYLNMQGIYPGGGGGRLGYGIGMGGDDCAVVRCRGERNKHDVDFHLRDYVTRVGRVVGGSYFAPKGQALSNTGTLQDGSASQPLYQYRVGAHSNCLDLIVEGVEFDHGNAAIGVRGGRAEVRDCGFRFRDAQTNFSLNNIVVVAEQPASRILVSRCEIEYDDSPSNALAIVGGMRDVAGVHRGIEVSDVTVNGGTLLAHQGYTDASVRSNIDGVRFSRIRGSVGRGIVVGDNPGQNVVEYANNIVLEDCELAYSASAGTYREFVLVNDLANVTGVTVRRCKLDSSTSDSNRPIVKVQASAAISDVRIEDCPDLKTKFGVLKVEATTVADKIRFLRNVFDDTANLTEIRAAVYIGCATLGLVEFDDNAGAAALSPLDVRCTTAVSAGSFSRACGNRLTFHHNVNAGTFGPGLYASLPGTVTDPWMIADNIIRAITIATNSECIRFGSSANLILENNDLNTDWYAPGTYTAAARIPVGNRNINGTLTWRDSTTVDHAGKLYRNSDPSMTGMPVGFVVWKGNVAAGGKAGWIYVASGSWKAFGPVDA